MKLLLLSLPLLLAACSNEADKRYEAARVKNVAVSPVEVRHHGNGIATFEVEGKHCVSTYNGQGLHCTEVPR